MAPYLGSGRLAGGLLQALALGLPLLILVLILHTHNAIRKSVNEYVKEGRDRLLGTLSCLHGLMPHTAALINVV